MRVHVLEVVATPATVAETMLLSQQYSDGTVQQVFASALPSKELHYVKPSFSAAFY